MLDFVVIAAVVGFVSGIFGHIVWTSFREMFMAKRTIRDMYAKLATYKPEYIEKALGFRIEKRESL